MELVRTAARGLSGRERCRPAGPSLGSRGPQLRGSPPAWRAVRRRHSKLANPPQLIVKGRRVTDCSATATGSSTIPDPPSQIDANPFEQPWISVGSGDSDWPLTDLPFE
jgi:hypothetical protein